MYFRPTRRYNNALQQRSSSLGLTPAYVNGRARQDRPSSAPAVNSGDTFQVDQRLKLAQRTRGRSSVDSGSSADGPDRASPQPQPLPQVSPCAAYPTFSLERLPKHEQHMVDALVCNCMDVLLFS